jgi:hypothetical protein
MLLSALRATIRHLVSDAPIEINFKSILRCGNTEYKVESITFGENTVTIKGIKSGTIPIPEFNPLAISSPGATWQLVPNASSASKYQPR